MLKTGCNVSRLLCGLKGVGQQARWKAVELWRKKAVRALVEG